LHIKTNGLLVFTLTLVKCSAGIEYSLLLADLQALVDWEVVSLDVLHCQFSVFLLAKNFNEFDDQLLILIRGSDIICSSYDSLHVFFGDRLLFEIENFVDEAETKFVGT